MKSTLCSPHISGAVNQTGPWVARSVHPRVRHVRQVRFTMPVQTWMLHATVPITVHPNTGRVVHQGT